MVRYGELNKDCCLRWLGPGKMLDTHMEALTTGIKRERGGQ